MADFSTAEKITGRNEGGYAFNKADTGGETYAGISRNNWPKWGGWLIIDSIKKNIGTTAKVINLNAASDPNMSSLASKFYKQNFWDVNKLDLVNDQQAANTVYDFGVNSGTGRSAKFLQEVVGVNADGAIGNITLAAVNKMSPYELVTAYNKRREAFYRSIAKGNQAQFLKSWLSRLKPYTK